MQLGRFLTPSSHTYLNSRRDTLVPAHFPSTALPQKRVKMASPPNQASQSIQDTDTHQQPLRNQNRHHDRPHHAAQQQPHNPNQPMNYMPSVRAASEKKLGLLHFSSPQNHGWHGDVRKRYVATGIARPQQMRPLSLALRVFCCSSLTHRLAEFLKLTSNRFTDFLVNEIQKNGEVLHLSDYSLGPRPTDAVSCSILDQLFLPETHS